ncbi:MAG: hypothetical protein JF567_02190 [Xanthomonadales bacterium]|nr:hypothetical protein [Xanthomonadales bacterium]
MKHDFIDENAREQLSALLDGELDGDAARFLQRRLQHDDALVGQLVRWQLAGDVLRASARSGGEDDLASRVRAAIEREQTHVAAKPKSRRGWMLWGSGLAAAAALGFAALNLPGSVDPISAPVVREVAAANAPAKTAPVITAAAEAPRVKQPAAIAAVAEPVQHRVAEVAPRHRQREVPAGPAVTNTPSREHREVQETSPVATTRETTTVLAANIPARTKTNRNPFTMRAAAPQSEPAWPKAVLPGFNSGLNADFRSDGNAGNPFMPHRPYQEPLPDR